MSADTADPVLAQGVSEAAESHIRMALDSLAGALFKLDSDLNFQVVSGNVARIFALPAGLAAVGASIVPVFRFRAERGDFGPGHVDELVDRSIGACRDPLFTPRLERIPGRVLEVSYTRATDGGIVVVASDVTERIAAEKALVARGRQDRALFERAPVMMHRIDAESRLLDVNEKWLEMTGYTREEVIGRKFGQFLTEASRRLCETVIMPRFIEMGFIRDVPYQMVRKDRLLIDVTVTETAETDQDGSFLSSRTILIDVTEKRQVEKKLAEKEKELRIALDNMPGGLFTLNKNLEFQLITKRYAEHHKLPPEMVKKGASIIPIIEFRAERGDYGPGEIRDLVKRRVESLRNQINTCLITNIPGGKSEIYQKPTGDGGSIIVFHDVTDRVRAEAALAESEARYRDLFDRSPAMMHNVDSNFRLTNVNRSWLDTLGFANDDVIGHDFTEFLTADSRRYVLEVVHDLMKENGVVSEIPLQLINRNGDLIDVLMTAHGDFDEQGNLVTARSALVDVTEQMEAERQLKEHTAALRQSEVRLLEILSKGPAGAYIRKANGEVCFANARIAEILRIPEETFLKSSIKEFHANPDEFEAIDRKFKAEGAIQGDAVRVRRYDGELGWMMIWLYPFEFENQDMILGFALDITERVQREDDLHEARAAAEAANQAKSRFLATMSHEIRTPINGVIGMVDLLGRANLNLEQANMVRIVHDSAFSLLNVINDILDFSKIEAGALTLECIDLSICDVVDGVAETLLPIAAGKNVALSVFVDPDIPDHVLGDPVRVRQILLNLVGNAIKFTHPEDNKMAEVVARAELATLGPGRECSVRFTVSDSGIGIPEDKIGSLFTPFSQGEASTTRRFGGTGLGLSIAKTLTELMGGKISAQSQVGKGATFTVAIPFEVVTERLEPESYSGLSGVHILVALSDPNIRSTAKAYLNHSGAKVEFADGVGGAEAKMSAAAMAHQPYDVVIFAHSPDKAATEDKIIESLRDAPLSANTGFVILTTDHRNRHQSTLRDTLQMGAYPLRRNVFLRTVATAAGLHLAGDVAKANRSHADSVKATRSKPATRRHELVLVAEDNAVNQALFRRQLDHLGFAAHMTSNGVAALKAFDDGNYDLLITDCHMPLMDGYELARAIRERERDGRKRLPIIAITANVLQGEADQCLAAGMDAYLPKPVVLEKLSETIEKWIPRRQPDGKTSAAGEGTPVRPERKGGDTVALSNGAPEAPNAGMPIDFALLSRLLGSEDMNYLNELLRFFWDTMVDVPRDLAALIAARDAAALRDAAHAAKGASAAAGAGHLSALLKDLQLAATSGDWQQIEVLFPKVDKAFSELEQFVGNLDAA